MDIVDLNFKVTREYRRAFKILAARLGITGKELFERAMESFLNTLKNTDPSNA